MPKRLVYKFHAALERRFPEKRLFLRSDTETRFIRLKPETQALAWCGTALFVGWTIVASAILVMDSIGAGNFRAQAERDRRIYEDRLSAIAADRDIRLSESQAAQEHFAAALAQISTMQTEILRLEDQKRELATGIEVIQTTLRTVMQEREAARAVVAQLTEPGAGGTYVPAPEELNVTLDMLSEALAQTAEERDHVSADAQSAIEQAAELELELRLMAEHNDEIFRQLEEAMVVSVEPLNQMFRAAGMDPQRMLDTVRRRYSGQGGPLATPIAFPTNATMSQESQERANAIIDTLDNINLYRIAAEMAPFDMPVRSNYRLTSNYGSRWGRMHQGTDFAGPVGTPIYATADGVVIENGWVNGYGRMIKIQHEFGIETRYAHLSASRVQLGQRVSRGDRIGDMGNTGNSTGPHLHYEIRVGGQAVNPMIYIRAGQDVF